MLSLNNLKSPKGSNRNTKRLGRGQGSGQGTQAGKGHKGQKARKSGHVRTGFEGNNLPLYMKMPKRGFKNYFHKNFAEINLSSIEKNFTNEEVNKENLIKKGLIKSSFRSLPVKILCNGKITKKLTFNVEKLSESAQKAIVAAGGKILTK